MQYTQCVPIYLVSDRVGPGNESLPVLDLLRGDTPPDLSETQ